MRAGISARPTALSMVLVAVLALQTITGLIPVSPSAGATTPQHQLTPYDALSGGVWARITNFGQSPLSAGQVTPRASPTSGSAATDTALPPSKFSSNFRVSTNKTTSPLEDEPSIAASNATGHPILVMGANSLSTQKMVSYYSTDQGTTWLGPTYLPLANNATDSFASDPGLGADRSGTFYYSFLSIGYFPSFGDNLVVATSTNGHSFTNHIAVPRASFGFSNSSTRISSELYDKEYLAVGPSASNPTADAIYVTYTDFIQYCGIRGCGQNSTIMEVHSHDSGVTWSKPVAVSPNMTEGLFGVGGIVQGSMPVVAPNGDLYVAYYDSGSDGWLSGSATIMIAKSTDGGNTFSAPRQAAFIPQEMTYSSGGGFFGGFRWWSSMFPSMDVAPDGTVYISYCAKQNSTTKDPSDVYLVSSTDAGATWSAPMKVNDDHTANGQFFSWLKVTKDGVVHIIWGDQRLDPTNIGYDVFYAEATNHGSVISPNSRVTDVGTDPTYTNGFVGDYFNIAVLGNHVYAAWTDGRRAIELAGKGLRAQILYTRNTDIFMARLGARAPANISFGGVPPAGYFAPVTMTGSNLPMDAFFTMRMNGSNILSQSSGSQFFFTDDRGRLTDTIVPNTDYFGSVAIEADDWISGLPFAQGSIVIVDTRSLQVQVTGPTLAFPGDNITWSVRVISPGGSPAQSSSITSAELIMPNGSTTSMMSSVVASGAGAYSISSKVSGAALPGSYTLVVNAALSGSFVRSIGFGSSTLIISSDLIATRNAANSAVQQLNQALNQLSKEQNLSQSIQQQLSATQNQLNAATNQLNAEQTYTLIVGAIAVVAVVLEAIILLRKKA